MTKAINFDPNYVANLNMAKQKIKLVFGVWEYRADFTIDIETNRYGIDSIRIAIEKVYNSIFNEKRGFAIIKLKDIEGNELQEWDDQNNESEWLESILISAEIVSYKEGRKYGRG